LARTPPLSRNRQDVRRLTADAAGEAGVGRAESRPAAARHAPAGPQEPAAFPDVPGGAPALDRLIHERLRLGIVSALAVNESLSFNDLKHLLGTTDGNLSVHARKLEEAAYVTCTKYFVGRQPKTEYRLTQAGREALQRYLDYMESLIRATRRPGAS
jgi:DNA-binding HxlR family transcriptional regulator